MAELTRPAPRFRRSFLAAMDEFIAEGRAGDDSMVGSDLERFGSVWHTDAGFEAYVDQALLEAERPR